MHPGIDERVYPAYELAPLLHVLHEEGVEASAALAGTDLREADLRSIATRLSRRQLLIAFANAQRLARSPTLALQAGGRVRASDRGIYGYALLSSATPQEAFDFIVKYQRFVGPPVSLDYRREGDIIVWHPGPLAGAESSAELSRFALEYHVAMVLNLLRDAVGSDFSPIELRLTHPAPPHAERYAEFFACPVRFAQPRDELRIAASLLEQRLRQAESVTSSRVRELGERELVRAFRNGGTAGSIYRMLIEKPREFPDIEAVADSLGYSARTLRRRLTAESTSYREILSDVRRHLASRYLRETPMTNEEIADRLGYSDAANFRKAFKQWTHMQPSSFRAGGLAPPEAQAHG